MNPRERQSWFIVATLFLVLFLVVGAAYGSIGVFVPALLKAFPDWSRAKVSLLPSFMAFSAGVPPQPLTPNASSNAPPRARHFFKANSSR